jgi:hypothetical protein
MRVDFDQGYDLIREAAAIGFPAGRRPDIGSRSGGFQTDHPI